MGGRYRPRADVVEAIQYQGDNDADVLAFAEGCAHLSRGGLMAVVCMPGPAWRAVSPGSWIAKYLNGEIRVYGNDEFYALFNSVEGE